MSLLAEIDQWVENAQRHLDRAPRLAAPGLMQNGVDLMERAADLIRTARKRSTLGGVLVPAHAPIEDCHNPPESPIGPVVYGRGPDHVG